MTSRTTRIAMAGVAIAALLALAACTSAPPVAQGTAPPRSASPQAASRIPAGAPEASAVSSGGVQRIAVDVSQGIFDPMVIDAKAGEPLEITFGPGQGCMSKVLMRDFGVSQDLTAGGAVVKLPVLTPGEYTFSCGMEMQFGKLVVK